MGLFLFAAMHATAQGATWPDSGPHYLSLVSQKGKVQISVSNSCAAPESAYRDWGTAAVRRADTGGEHGVCIKLPSATDAIRITPAGGKCEVRPGLSATEQSAAATLTEGASEMEVAGCLVGEIGSQSTTSFGGVTIEFADGYVWSASFHGVAPELVRESPPGAPSAGAGVHAYRYRVDLHLASPQVEIATSAVSALASPGSAQELNQRPAERVPQNAGAPVQLVPEPALVVPQNLPAPQAVPPEQPLAETRIAATAIPTAVPAATADTPKSADPAPTTWSTDKGLRLRAQIGQWIDQANAGGCASQCYRLADRNPRDPVEPWKVTMATTFSGDFLTALTGLRDGFWDDPRPDIEVTKNNVIILRPLGAQ